MLPFNTKLLIVKEAESVINFVLQFENWSEHSINLTETEDLIKLKKLNDFFEQISKKQYAQKQSRLPPIFNRR